MTPSVPELWPAVLLTLAAYRTFRLLALDTILDRPRDWLCSRDIHGESISSFITCPWCAGFWISIGWWTAWLASDEWAVFATVPFAISAVVGLVAKLDTE